MQHEAEMAIKSRIVVHLLPLTRAINSCGPVLLQAVCLSARWVWVVVVLWNHLWKWKNLYNAASKAHVTPCLVPARLDRMASTRKEGNFKLMIASASGVGCFQGLMMCNTCKSMCNNNWSQWIFVFQVWSWFQKLKYPMKINYSK